MHIGKTKSYVTDLYVGRWKTEVVTDPVTGSYTQTDTFQGDEKMKLKQEQHLGDL